MTAIGLGLLLALPELSARERLDLRSPDGGLVMALSIKEKRLGYTLARGENQLLNWAPLGLTMDGVDSGSGVQALRLEKEFRRQKKTFPVVGVKSEATVIYNEYQIGGLNGGQRLRVRVFGDGVALRYEFTAKAGVRVESEQTSFGIPADATLWMQDSRGPALWCAEGYFGSIKMRDFPQKSEQELHKAENDNYYRSFVMSTPVTADLGNGSFVFLQEAGLSDAGWCGAKYAFLGDRAQVFYFNDRKGFTLDGTVKYSPWRVVIAARDLNELVNADIVGALVPAPDRKLFPNGSKTDWIRPGRGVWTWLATRGARYKDQFAFIEMAGELGYEYNLVDEGYEKWQTEPGQTFWDLLANVVEHGKKHNVKIWIWKHWSRDRFNDPADDWRNMRDFMKRAKQLGVVGFKMDFMNSDSQDRMRYYDAVLRIAAENKLMVNFHGSNVPTGEIFSWPNEMTRESVAGLEFWKLPPEHMVVLPFTRFVAGPGDFTPGLFNHNLEAYGTPVPSWPQRMAQLIVYTSPVQHMVSGPADVADAAPKGSLQREILQALPTVWDETRVLSGAELGKLAPFARRKGNEWFVGVINGREQRNATIGLDFLKPGVRYRAVLLADDPAKPDSWLVSEKIVTAKDTLPAEMRGVGGFVVRLVPVK